MFLKFASDFLLSSQCTALHLAAENGHTAACQLLIACNADVTAKSECAFMFKFASDFVGIVFLKSASDFLLRSQCTALHRAASRGHQAACQLLIARNSDVNATDRCAFMFKMCC